MQHGIGNLAERRGFFLGDFVDSVRGVVNKVVPRELKPILPVATAAFLGPVVGNMFSALGPAAAGFLGAGTTSALTQALTGSGKIDPTSTLLSAGIGGIRGFQVPKAGVEKFDYSGATGRTPMVDGQQDVFLRSPQEIEAARQAVEPTFFEKQIEKAQAFTGKANIDPITGKAIFDSDVLGIPTTGTGPESFLKGAAAYSIPYTAKAAAEEQLDLEEQERQEGIESAARKRKDKEIYIDFVMRAGFTREEAERMAEGAGYDEGGKVMLASDPDPADERNTMRENLAPKLFGKEYDKLSDDEVIELDEAIEEMTTKAPKKEKRMTAQEGDFVSGIEAILNLPNITPTKRPDTEMDEEDEVDAFSERMERLGEDKFVSSGDTMKILRFFSKNPDAEQQYSGQLKDYIEQGKGSNAFFDSVLGSNFSEGGKVPGLPPGKQVDAREGMFIPMGGAKRADDVPAMLSVNEFVLNDNAVAGLGKMLTGTPDPRAGARALYKIQDQLEAMVV
jgi:hypothetical protein